jgi:outer membrane protein
MIFRNIKAPNPKTAVAALCLLAAAGVARADNLLNVWRAAQLRDSAYLSARQTLQLAQQRSPAVQSLARERLRLTEQELALRVANAYFDAAVAQQGAELALAQLNAMAQQLRLAQRSLQAGAAGNAELREARLRFDAARAQRVAATRELEQRRAELEKMSGRLPETLDQLRADAPLWMPEPADPEFWASQASQGNPKVRLQQAVLDAAVQEVARARDGVAPNVEFTADRGRIVSDGALNTPGEMAVRSRSAQLGLVLTVPLYGSGGGSDSRLRDALASQSRAEAQLAVARGQAAAQASQSAADVLQGLARADALAGAAKDGRGAFERVQAGFRAGARFRADASVAVQRFYAAERDWSKARVEAVKQGLQLKAAAGSLDEADIARVNSMLAAAPAAPVQQLP